MNRTYWQTASGQHVLHFEQALLTEHIRRFHGDTVMWAGTHGPSAVCMQRCMVRNPVFFDLSTIATDPVNVADRVEVDTLVRAHESESAAAPVNPSANTPANRCLGALEQLPFKSNSVDGVVLHHGLEITADPRTALREVTRVLAPGGRLILVGFNPMSLFGLRCLYGKVVRDKTLAGGLIHPLRLFDWLAVLGFELQDKPLYAGHALPFTGSFKRFASQPAEMAEAEPGRLRRWRQRSLAWSSEALASLGSPFGGLLIVSAIKPSSAPGMHWRSSTRGRQLAPVAYPRVAQWRLSDRK
ncbi:MAG: class I SAM-dependent methyltransferase [Pseudomonadota bacterium]